MTAAIAAMGRVRCLDADVLIIGGGLAGLRAALSARQAGATVIVVGKRQIGRSGSSVNTTGGFAAVLPDLNADDDRRLHVIDTIAGGGFVNDRRLVRVLAEEAPARLHELLKIGVQFRGAGGHLHLSPSGDHTRSRVLVPKNMRGIDLTLPLREAALAAGVDFLEDCIILDLLKEDGSVAGALGVNRLRPEGYVFHAGAVILAAGGAGQLFCTTSNPVDVCGSGYALAFRAGARLRDMEFIQFYPWRLIRPFKSTRVPIQPSTFALGARLYNSRGERFMGDYDPLRWESTTRDLSARGIADQINKGLSVEGGVVLDVSGVPDEQFRFENPRVVDLLERKNVDYRSIQLIVAPEAHYFMGGVDIDVQGQASLPGLFAAGENAGGVHGGNRLNSNSVPDTQVFGHRAGMAAAARVRACGLREIDKQAVAELTAVLDGLVPGEASSEIADERARLREAMSRTLGLVRDAAGLALALETARDVHARVRAVDVHTHADLLAKADLMDLCETAQACAASAICRTESRAAHFRSDFPDSEPSWVRTVLYDRTGISLRQVDVEPDEEILLEFRKACAPASAQRAREHVE